MREISVLEIEQAVRDLCIQANRSLPTDVCEAVACACQHERVPLAREILCDLEENVAVAQKRQLPVCQDTGMAVVFVELGQEVHVTGGLLEEAINRGVARGYTEGLLRCSVVSDPLERVNTNDNTPAIIHVSLVAGDTLTLT
ncbi:MAG: fumarate hydratase, partial [Clostridia bacterium]|nr:fumarate hydratase [Clostridia bacterium]